MGCLAVAMSLSVHVRKRLSPQFRLDVALDVAAGVTIVFGESGSGKTTLLRCVAGLTLPDGGRISMDGRVLFDARAGVSIEPSRRQVGFVFQQLALFPHLTAADNIMYGLAGMSPRDRHERMATIAEAFRITHLLGRRPGEISGGERQRVGLARSLVMDPKLLLLDEPLSALDHTTQSRIIGDLHRWNSAHQIPILYVTHSQREVFALGERVLVVQEGTIVADGTPQDVMESPSHARLAQLAGFENVLAATVVNRRPEAGVMSCRLAGTNVDLETPLADVETGGSVRVAVRAGDILIATEPPRGLSARNVLPATIKSLTRQGAVLRAEVNIGVPIEVHLTPTSGEGLGLRPGSSVWLVVKTHSCRPAAAV